MKLDQFMWAKGKFRLYATKTENQRDLPLWEPIKKLVQNRIKNGLTDGEYLFPNAKIKPGFDKEISGAALEAGKTAKLLYGQANGFTLHSLRHTFITHMMEATNNDIPLVMEYSGHKSLKAFRTYLHPTEEGASLAKQAIHSVGLLLASFPAHAGSPGQLSIPVKPLKQLQVAD